MHLQSASKRELAIFATLKRNHFKFCNELSYKDNQEDVTLF
jgi:hypothetical protein